MFGLSSLSKYWKRIPAVGSIDYPTDLKIHYRVNNISSVRCFFNGLFPRLLHVVCCSCRPVCFCSPAGHNMLAGTHHLTSSICYCIYGYYFIFFTTSNVNGTVYPYCADVPLRNYSLIIVVVIGASAVRERLVFCIINTCAVTSVFISF